MTLPWRQKQSIKKLNALHCLKPHLMSHNQTLPWQPRSPHTHSLTLHRAQGPTAAARPPQLNSCSKISSLKPPRQIFPFLPAVTAPDAMPCAWASRIDMYTRIYIPTSYSSHFNRNWAPISPFTQSNVTIFKNQMFFTFCTTMFPSCAHLQFQPWPHVAHGDHEYVIKSSQINR